MTALHGRSGANMMPPTAKSQLGMLWPVVGCGLAGIALFQFFGNATQGYIDSASLFYWWGYQWANPASEAEHGWLILGLSLWLFWRNARAQPVAANPPWRGRAVAAMLAGLALHLLGYAVQQTRISIIAFLIFTWGVLTLAGGRRWGRAAIFPLGFMIFAIPVNVLDTAGFWLRMWVIHASHALAHLAGIEVIRSGTQLFSPDGAYQYDVAAACSGVRSLMALTALSLLMGYLNFRSWWLRLCILLLSFPFTYVGNVVRIGGIIFVAEWLGQRAGELFHEWAGFLVFVIVLGLVLLSVNLLRRFFPTHAVAEESEPAPFWAAPMPQPAAWRIPAVAVLATLAVAVLTHRFDTLPLRTDTGVYLAEGGINPVDLPAFVGTEWIGRRTEVTAVEREILPPDTGFSRRLYLSVENPRRQVFLSIVLSGRDRTSIHRPELCIVGQGWNIRESGRHEFLRPDTGERIPVTLLHVEQRRADGEPGLPAIMAYWFVSSEGVVATHAGRMLRGAWDRLRHGRADRWGYVLVQTQASDGEAAALGRLGEVLEGTLPAFQKSLGGDK